MTTADLYWPHEALHQKAPLKVGNWLFVVSHPIVPEALEKVLNCLLIREWHGVDPGVMLQMEPLSPWQKPILIIFADA